MEEGEPETLIVKVEGWAEFPLFLF
jgi:hypothetical protein